MSQKVKCKYPPCSQNAVSANPYGMCFRHGDMLEFMLWALQTIQVKAPAQSSIWTPEVK